MLQTSLSPEYPKSDWQRMKVGKEHERSEFNPG